MGKNLCNYGLHWFVPVQSTFEQTEQRLETQLWYSLVISVSEPYILLSAPDPRNRKSELHFNSDSSFYRNIFVAFGFFFITDSVIRYLDFLTWVYFLLEIDASKSCNYEFFWKKFKVFDKIVGLRRGIVIRNYVSGSGSGRQFNYGSFGSTTLLIIYCFCEGLSANCKLSLIKNWIFGRTETQFVSDNGEIKLSP